MSIAHRTTPAFIELNLDLTGSFNYRFVPSIDKVVIDLSDSISLALSTDQCEELIDGLSMQLNALAVDSTFTLVNGEQL